MSRSSATIPPSAAPPKAGQPAASAAEPGIITTGELALHLKARLVGPSAINLVTVETLDRARAGALGFIGASRYAAAWQASSASAAIVRSGIDVPGHDPAARALLIVDDFDAATAAALELFGAASASPLPPRGIHPSAIIDPSAQVGRNVAIGPGCIIGPGARIADGVTLHGNVSIAPGASVGRDTIIHHGVVIGDRCTVGAACILHPGVVVGADGFGYRPSPDGRGLIKIPHIGAVEIGDHVEIGANSCIDRAKFGATTIGSGTKIDNLVQIAHNCRIGRSCILCGLVGLAGSVRLGDGVVLGGGVGVADHVSIGDAARVGARSGVMNDIPAGETWLGYPATPAGQATRNYAAFRNLAESLQRLRRSDKQPESR